MELVFSIISKGVLNTSAQERSLDMKTRRINHGAENENDTKIWSLLLL